MFKVLGLLGGERASSSYWPVDFTARGAMNLLGGASLGQEQLVMLKNPSGQWNFSSLGGSSRAPKAASSPDGAAQPVSIKRLKLRKIP